MCLGIPAKIVSVEGKYADADINGSIIRIGIHLLDNVKPGDFVLIHTGYALEIIDEDDAQETLNTIRDLDEFNRKNLPPANESN